MKTVDKIIFNDKEYYMLYKGSELLYEVNRKLDYLNFTALEPSTILYKPYTASTAQYSFDKVNWETADNVTLNLNTGDKVYFKGNITSYQDFNNYAKFTMTGKIAASGSIMSLQAGNPEDNSINYAGEFICLFENCTSLISAPKLPATTLTEYCYWCMLKGCTSLVKAPELPAKTLKFHCYGYMFLGCTSLVNAPALPATALAERCYWSMFYGCTSLVKAPDLPATEPVDECHYCYVSMFENCVNLKYIKCSAKYYIYNWFDDWLKNVSPTGDFYCYDASIFPTGGSGIPEGWTVNSEI